MAIEDLGDLAAALPGYELGGELGRGAFGVVLAGRHRQLGRRVAIKQLPRAFSDQPDVRHRFSAEAKILASLDHPHIVPIFDYVEQGGLCVLVMELLPGGTVRQRHLPITAACAVALASSSALDYAHQRGVLHRDVKPDNVMFTSTGLLKITDFGIARVVGDAAITKVGDTIGTPMYMAPEQCLGQPLSPATDVYSTALMLYELLAGRHPFAGGEAVAVMYRQIHEVPAPLSTVNTAVPDEVADVVMRALAKDPAARFPSARAFGGALAEAAARSWGDGWPAGEAARIMSVGPVGAGTGWPVSAPPARVNAADRDTFEPDRSPAGTPEPAPVPSLQPTVLRGVGSAFPTPVIPPPFPAPVVPPPFPDASPPPTDNAFPGTRLWAPPASAQQLDDPWGSGYWAASGTLSPETDIGGTTPLAPADWRSGGSPTAPPPPPPPFGPEIGESSPADGGPPVGGPPVGGPPVSAPPAPPPAPPAGPFGPAPLAAARPAPAGPPPPLAGGPTGWPPAGSPLAPPFPPGGGAPVGPAGAMGASPADWPTEALPEAGRGLAAPAADPWSDDRTPAWAADPAPTSAYPVRSEPQYPNLSDPSAEYPPPRPASRHWIVAAVLAVCAIGVGALVGLVLVHRQHPSPSGTTTPPSGPAQVAATISGLIRQSSAARAQVVGTVASIQDCSANLQTAASTLQSAVGARQEVVNSLQGLTVTGLPNGVALRAALISALNDSIAADHHYQNWLAAIISGGGCTGQAATNGDYDAAVRSSDAADGAKATFVNLWNPIATTYHLPKVTSSSI